MASVINMLYTVYLVKNKLCQRGACYRHRFPWNVIDFQFPIARSALFMKESLATNMEVCGFSKRYFTVVGVHVCVCASMCASSHMVWRSLFFKILPSGNNNHKNYAKNNAWVTVNNDFLVTSETICQWFSWVTKPRVKIIVKSLHEWPKNRYSR